MTTLITDPFTYSNGALTSVASSVWSTLTSETSWQVNSNQLNVSAFNQDDCNYVNSTALSSIANDQWAQVSAVCTVVDATGSGVGLALRCATGARTTYRMLQSSTAASIAKMVAGSYTLLTAPSSSMSGTHTVYAEVQGTSLVIKLDSSTVASTTDSAISSGRFGVQHSSDTNTSSHLDDFIGGDFSSGGLPPGLGPGGQMDAWNQASIPSLMR